MNLNTLSKRISQGQFYQTPVADIYTVETEDTLAKSNTEQIIEDNDEYDWGD